uniref:SEA domain-containing protein n=1 Tax=Panagrellus redivivus TaxID=6233 RepID=A0A7E4V1J2_PANRE
MSISGSGRFRSIYVEDLDERHSSFSSSGRSGAFYPAAATVNAISYEPATGAEYMYQKGWHNRDAYGKSLPNPSRPTTIGTKTGGSSAKSSKDGDLFAKENRAKVVLIILLTIVSLLLIAFVIVIIVLFATGVFTTHHATEAPSIYSTFIFTTTPPPNYDTIVAKTYDIELYLISQANSNFSNPNTDTYRTAMRRLQAALENTMTQSTLRDLQPSIGMLNIQNSNLDLQVNFQLAIVIPSRSPITAGTIKNLFLSELPFFERQINQVQVDRSRISVTMET